MTSPSVLGFVQRMISLMPSGSMRPSSSRILQLLGPDALERAHRAEQHVVAAVELAGALDGDDVARLLDHAHDVAVAAVVAAERAQLLVGDVEAAAQKRTFSLASRMAAASRMTSSAGILSRWKAMRWADRGPIPGSRPSSSMSVWTGGE